ncbi:hypothetical protein AB0F42_26405 [Streptomyces buecherae]|uniref:hypothetical protein n=1 Tax=Streptomyces buecherae TaxID=2763006 RepID=UPI0033DCCC55
MLNGAASERQVREALTAAGLKLPVVVKPPLGGGSLHVSVANSHAAVRDRVDSTDELYHPLVEQRIDGP